MKLREAVELYKQKKMTRLDIEKQFNLMFYEVNKLLARYGVPVWDRRDETNTRLMPITKYLEDYKNKKITRKEIMQREGLTHNQVYTYLKRHGYEIWDLKCKQKRKPKLKFKRDYERYANMIYQYLSWKGNL